MPTYSYKCDACGHSFEKEQRITEEPERECPACEKLEARRMISSANFILKGGGWYADGYGSSKSSASEDSGKKPDVGRSDGGSKSDSASPAASTSPAGTDAASKKPESSPSSAATAGESPALGKA